MKKLPVWWNLARGEHSIMTFLAIVAAAIVSTGKFSPNYLFFAAGPALIVLGSFIFNDYLDLPSDMALARKDRPLVSKQISPKAALYASAALFGAGLALCLHVSTIAFHIALFYSALSIAYSFYLKKVPLVGNAVVATTYAISFAYGNAVAINSLNPYSLNLLAMSFAAFAFLAGLGRELLITLRDVEGDKKIGALTLPMVVGASATTALASVLFLIAAFLTIIPIAGGMLSGISLLVYALLVGACDVLLLYSAYLSLRDSSKASLSKIRNYTLKAFQLALVGFFVVAMLKLV